jgi:hypothetical protein
MFFGLAAMVIGALDPLEGSVVILTGTAIVAIGARLDHSLRRRLAYLSLALIAGGVGALFGVGAIGGFGGPSGRSMWWGLLLLPYPIGWVIGLISAVQWLRAKPSGPVPAR